LLIKYVAPKEYVKSNWLHIHKYWVPPTNLIVAITASFITVMFVILKIGKVIDSWLVVLIPVYFEVAVIGTVTFFDYWMMKKVIK